MPGKRITELTALSGAGSANNDDLVIFNSGAGETKRISRSQLAEGMIPDLPLQYYLGVLTVNPTQRLNGDALQIGDYYLDSVTKYTTVYNGSSWNSYASVVAAQAAAEAARDAAIVARNAAQLAQTNAETAETNAETAETNAETAEAGAVAARLAAEAARDAAQLSKGIFESTAAALGNGVLGHGAITGGSSGTDGTFALAMTGGTEVVPVRGTFVVASGAVTQINIYYPGYYSSNPTGFDFSASSGLTSASASPVMGVNAGVGEYFSVPSTTPGELTLYKVTSGPAATEVLQYPSTAIKTELLDLRYGKNDFDFSDDIPEQFRDARSVLEGSANVRLTTTVDAGGNKINADGTITIGAGSWVEWSDIGSQTPYDPDGYYYIYIVPVDPATSPDISVSFWQNPAAAATPLEAPVVDRTQFGVVKVRYRNRNASTGNPFPGFFPRIDNASASDVSIVWPSLTRTDDARIPQRMLATLGVPNTKTEPSIMTFEFWEDPGFFDLDTDTYLRNATVSIDAVSGDDSTGTGTRFSPYQTLSTVGSAGSMSNGDIIALRRGSVWREQLAAYYGADVWDCVFVSDDRSKKGRMPVISSWLPISDGNIVDNLDGTYTFTFQPAASTQPALDGTLNNSYNRILVRERNVAADAAGNIISAGTVLRWTNTLADVQANAGRSFASYNAGTNTWTVTFSPRTGVTPLDTTNTYEVTQQASCISNALGSTNNKNATFLGLHFDGAASGYGMISSGAGSVIDFCALTGGDTHHSVMASMVLQRSFIGSVGDTSDSISVSYSVGSNTNDQVTVYDRNFIFSKGGPYAHNNSDETQPHEAMLITRQYIVGERDKVTNAATNGLGGGDQTRKIIRRHNYAKNVFEVRDNFASSFDPVVTTEYNFVDGVVRIQPGIGGMRQNIFIGQNYGDQNPSAPANRGVLGLQPTKKAAVFENNLFVVTHEAGNFVPSAISNYAADYSGRLLNSQFLGNGVTLEQTIVRRNIFVMHLPFAASVNESLSFFVGSTANTFGNFALDENIYVFLDCGVDLGMTAPAQDLTGPPILIAPANTGGTADIITLTTGQSLVVNPPTIVFTTGANANTGAVTVNVDGIGAVDLKSSAGAALTAGNLAANTRYAARFVGGEYLLLTFQTHIPGINVYRAKTGYEANGLFIDARGNPLGLNAVFRDFAARDLRWANTDIADQIQRFNAERLKDGKVPCGPNWTINRNVRQLTIDDAYQIINRRADILS